MMGIRIDSHDVFHIYAYGENDGTIIYLRINQKNALSWTKDKPLASQFTKDEADRLIDDAKKKGMKTYATRIVM